jgi:hypothetical protein
MPVRQSLARIEGKLMGTIMDHKPLVNIKPFGQCQSLANPVVAAATAANYGRLQKMPCVPNTTTPWIGGKMRVRICKEPTLLDSSKLMCMWAGVIEITNPGQNFVKEGGSSINSKLPSVQSEKKVKDVAVTTGESEKEEVLEPTVKNFVEILKKIEEKQGYEAARYYASNRIDYWKINKLAQKYVNEADEEKKEKEKDNDPNLMPSRFMLLYGADDGELRKLGNIDEHPDNFEDEPEHEISVEKLREALILFGNDIEKTGPFDDNVNFAFLQYLRRYCRIDLNRYYADSEIEDGRLDRLADEHGVFSWKYFEEHDRDHDNIIKELHPEYGDELLAEKGVNPINYLPGICYHYPWVPFRLTVELGDEYKNEDGEYKDEEAKYRIFGRKSGALLAEGEINESFKIEKLLPDAGELLIFVDEMEMEWNPDYSHPV